METVDSVAAMRDLANRLRSAGSGLSLVPTMGALNPGHGALIAAAVAAGRPVVVSVFVNPLSFGSNENFAGYPRSSSEDVALCESLGAAAVFMPSPSEVYPKGFSTFVAEEVVGKPLCGVSRPSHFRGVTTLAVKLLNIVSPTHVYAGQKDAQTVAVLRKMAADLNYAVDFVVVPTVRDEDGLVTSVRNHEMTPAQRAEALAISRSVKRAREMVESGVRSSDRLVAEVTHILGKHNKIRVIYASVVDASTMEAMREVVPGRSMICIAAWLDEIRLTDNALL
jgi:pantoate--beta-alanine ligase